MKILKKACFFLLVLAFTMSLMPINVLAADKMVQKIVPAMAGNTNVSEAWIPEHGDDKPDSAVIASADADRFYSDGSAPVKTQDFLEELISWGNRNLVIDDQFVLTEDFCIPEDVNIWIENGGSLTVPAGITLEILGYLEVLQDGSLTMEPDSVLIANLDDGLLKLSIWGGKADLTGADLSQVTTDQIRNSNVDGSVLLGVPQNLILMDYLVNSTKDILEVLADIGANGWYFSRIYPESSFILNEDIVIPEEASWNNWYSDVRVDIVGATVTNHGSFYLSENSQIVVGEDAKLQSHGYIFLEDNSSLTVAAGGVLVCEDYLQDRDYVATMIREESCLNVEEGGKLVLNSDMRCNPQAAVQVDGDVEIGTAPDGTQWHLAVDYRDGEAARVEGVPLSNQRLNYFDVYKEADIHKAIEYISAGGYGYGRILLMGDITLSEDLIIPEKYDLFLNGELTLIISQDVTVTNHGEISHWEGRTIQNNGTIENNGKFRIYGSLINDGQIKLNEDSDVYLYGRVTNNGAIYYHADSAAEIHEDAVLEGNDPIPMEEEHTHVYTEIVTDPTCTEEGYTTYTCECGESYADNYVKATGHIAGDWKYNETQHWQECTSCSEKIGAANHDGSVCSICGYKTPGEDTHDYQLGDVNHDGKINAKDATLILQKSVGVLKETAKFCEDCAEVSGDGKLNAKDSTLILQFSVGLRDSFPAQE